jgi:tungstate transport system substrate-binding protein
MPTSRRPTGRPSSTGCVAAEGQKAIADYKIGGEQLFFPNAAK